MSEPEATVAIPRRILRAAGRVARFRLLALINECFAYSGVTEEVLASRLGWSVARVRGVMRGTRRLSLRGAAELCWAIDGSIIEFTATPTESPHA